MTYYYFLFSGTLFLSICSYFKLSPGKNKIWFLSLLFLFVIFVGLRKGGVDYWGYYAVFQDNPFHFEKLFGGIVFVSSVLTGDVVFGFLSIAFLSIYLRFRTYEKYSPFFLFSVLIYMYTYFLKDMGQIRHALIASLFLFSFAFLADKKYLIYFLIVLVASQIHSFAYIGLLLPAVTWINPENPKTRVFFVSFIVIAFVISWRLPGLGHSFVNYIENTASSFNDTYISKKIIGYASSKYANVTSFGFGFLRVFLIFLLGTFFYGKASKYSRIYHISYVSYTIALVLLLVLRDFAILAGRSCEFFSTGEAIIITCVLKSLKPQERNLLFLFFVFSASAYFYLAVQSLGEYSNWLW